MTWYHVDTIETVGVRAVPVELDAERHPGVVQEALLERRTLRALDRYRGHPPDARRLRTASGKHTVLEKLARSGSKVGMFDRNFCYILICSIELLKRESQRIGAPVQTRLNVEIKVRTFKRPSSSRTRVISSRPRSPAPTCTWQRDNVTESGAAHTFPSACAMADRIVITRRKDHKSRGAGWQ